MVRLDATLQECREQIEARYQCHILRSYVRQLSSPVGNPGHVRQSLVSYCRQAQLRGSNLGIQASRDQLLDSVNSFSETTIVLDALDECDPTSRWQLVDALQDLSAKSERPLKLFISSRPDGDIRARFASLPNLEIQASDNQKDIEKYINEEIDRPRQWGPISDALRRHIVNVLLEKSQGMFQWTRLQIKQVLEIPTENDIRKRLGKLPLDLKHAYDEIYASMGQYEHSRNLTERIFTWMMYIAHGFCAEDVLEAIRYDFISGEKNCNSSIDIETVLCLCRNLIVVAPENYGINYFKFSHLSVIEYLENHCVSFEQGHRNIAMFCLNILTKRKYSGIRAEYSTDSKKCAESQGMPSVWAWRYVHSHWAYHVREYDRYLTTHQQKADMAFTELLKSFLGSPGKSSVYYRGWFSSFEYGSSPDLFMGNYFPRRMSTIGPAEVTICTMCCFSFFSTLKEWWESAEFSLEQENAEGVHILKLAAQGGSASICDAIIRRAESNPSVLELRYGSALIAAGGSTDCAVDLLHTFMSRRSEFRITNEECTESLTQAIRAGSVLGVGYLLDMGVVPLEGLHSCLRSAICSGSLDLVKLFIQLGANPNECPDKGWKAPCLLSAIRWRLIDIARFLLKSGADPNLLRLLDDKDRYDLMQEPCSALAWAVQDGRMDFVILLIEEGADPNLLDPFAGSALIAAVTGNSLQLTTYLLEHGADPNLLTQYRDHGSALIAAAAAGAYDVAELLICNGAEPGIVAPHGFFGTALIAAAFAGAEDIIELLLCHGADPNIVAPIGAFGSALAAASWFGLLECARILLDGGANASVFSGKADFNTPMQATRAPFLELERDQIDWFMERVDMQGKERIRAGRARVADLLRAHGADD